MAAVTAATQVLSERFSRQCVILELQPKEHASGTCPLMMEASFFKSGFEDVAPPDIISATDRVITIRPVQRGGRLFQFLAHFAALLKEMSQPVVLLFVLIDGFLNTLNKTWLISLKTRNA